jgi:hypothetical protein
VGTFGLQLSLKCTPPHALTGTYTLTPSAVPVPKELAGLNTPIWILLLLSWVPKGLAIIQADLALGKTWSQIGLDLLVALLGPQANVTPRRVRQVENLLTKEAEKAGTKAIVFDRRTQP